MASPIRNERNSSKALHYINRYAHTKVLYSTCVVYFTVIQRMALENFNRMVLNFI